MVRITPAERAIGTILPSSNRVVERVTAAVLADHPDIDACFARISYHGDSKGQPSDGYDLVAFADAAALLAHAGVGVICWNGTRGAALGFDPDRRLCDAIGERTGVPALTTALATLDVLKSAGLRRIALVAQGSERESAVIAAQFARQGIVVAAGQHLDIFDNFAAATTPERVLEKHVETLARQRNCDAVLIWSTNLPGYRLTRDSVSRFGLPVLDSATIGIESALLTGFGIGASISALRNDRVIAEI